MSNQRRPTEYLVAPTENLPPNSILNSIRVGNTVKPPPHLLRMFSTYVENEVLNPTNLPQVDFDEFGRKWLPLFNYGAHEDHSRIPLMDWVSEVSGSPYREVRLMQHRGGVYVEVARIPAIFDRLTPVMKDDDRDYFAQIAAIQSVIHRGGQHIREADGFIERNMTNRIEIKKALSDNFHRMSAIFNLYGVERQLPNWIIELEGSLPSKQLETKQATPAISVTSGMMEED